MSLLDNFIFNYYPYIALAVCISVTYYRFAYRPSTITTHSSQILSSKSLTVGSNLFHVGLLMVLIGHVLGMLTPLRFYDSFISPRAHLVIAMIAGGIFGVLALIGGVILFLRRLSPRFNKLQSRRGDMFSLLYILLMLLTGMATLPEGVGDIGGESIVWAAKWAQGIVTFRENPAQYAMHLGFPLKLHMFLGLTLLLVSPFTKLVHLYAGVGAIIKQLFFRSYKIIYRGEDVR